MKHGREDYNRIQDPENKIPQDEPVFLLRAQDVLAADIVEQYAEFAAEEGLVEISNSAYALASEMRKYRESIGDGKLPDIKKVSE